MLNETDQYKFLGKYKNATQLEEQVYTDMGEEYIKRLSVIWTSNISVPRKIRATNTFAESLLQYHMWTAKRKINDLKDADKTTREIIRESSAMHKNESVRLFYLPGNLGGSGLESIEDSYKLTKIKMANYINNCKDKGVQVVNAHEMEKILKISKNRKSLFKDANKYAAEYSLTCEFDNTNTILKDIDGKTTQINSQSPQAIKNPLRQALQKKYIENMKERAWLGALTTKQLEDPDMPPNANQVFRKWKNIPDTVYSVNNDIRQTKLQTMR